MLGRAVPVGAIFHVSSRRRREVGITLALRQMVVETAEAIRSMLVSNNLPPPVNDARCKECSMKEICQPAALANATRLKRMHDELLTTEP